MTNINALKKILLGFELTINFNKKFAYIGLYNEIDYSFALELYYSPLLAMSGGNQAFSENYFRISEKFILNNNVVKISNIKFYFDNTIGDFDNVKKCLNQIIREEKLKQINEKSIN